MANYGNTSSYFKNYYIILILGIMKKSEIMKNIILLLFLLFILNKLNASNFNCSSIYNPNDVTDTLQYVIDNFDVDTITIPNMGEGTVWHCGSITLRNNLEIVFENGVIFQALSGFDENTSFINIYHLENVSITGNGAVVRMPIEEYDSGEHRHCISIYNGSNITIKNIELDKSGGDGIYIGRYGDENMSNKYSENILVDNVIINGQARNGISIVSAKNVIINKCIIQNTGNYNLDSLASGGPYAGVDLEPNKSFELLENIEIKNSKFIDNLWRGILISIQNLNNTSNAISVNIDNNIIEASRWGFQFVQRNSSQIHGNVQTDNLYITNTYDNSISFLKWGSQSLNIVFKDCILENPTNKGLAAIEIDNSELYTDVGNIYMYNMYIARNSDYKSFLYNPNNKLNKMKNCVYELFHESRNDSYDILGIFENVTFEHKLILNKAIKTFVGDYNGDGKADLFTKGYGTWRVLYLANSGTRFNRQFASSTDNVGGTDSEGFLTDPSAEVYPGDYNGDGKTDLFVKGYGTWRALYLANSTGTGFVRQFASSEDNVNGTDSEGFLTDASAKVYPGDYNGDGKTDLFVKGFETYRALYLANSTGTGFTRVFMSNADNVGGTDSELFLTDASAKVYPGDYNGDGKTDLFVKGFETYRALYIANSSGTGFNRQFATSNNYISGTTDNFSWFTYNNIQELISSFFEKNAFSDIDKNETENKDILFYPNPASSSLKLNVPVRNDYDVKIVDINGKIIKNIKCSQSNIVIDVSDIPQGIYIIQIFTSYDVYQDKIVIKR